MLWVLLGVQVVTLYFLFDVKVRLDRLHADVDWARVNAQTAAEGVVAAAAERRRDATA